MKADDLVLLEGARTPMAEFGASFAHHSAIELGAIIMPPMPAFYHRPQTVDDIVNQSVNRVLDLFDIELEEDLFERWQGPAYGKADQ